MIDLKFTENQDLIGELNNSAIQTKTVAKPQRTESHIKRNYTVGFGQFNSSNQLTFSQCENPLCHQVTFSCVLCLFHSMHVLPSSNLYTWILPQLLHYTMLQRRTGDPFSLKAQRKSSPCPIKRDTLKPSMLLATEPLILLRSLWQEKTFQTSRTTLEISMWRCHAICQKSSIK